jgi:hypothetical protein
LGLILEEFQMLTSSTSRSQLSDNLFGYFI